MSPRWAMAKSRLVGSPTTAASIVAGRLDRALHGGVLGLLAVAEEHQQPAARPGRPARRRPSRRRASPRPTPSRRPSRGRRAGSPSIVGVNGSRVQPSPGGTTSRCDTSASVGPGAQPRTSIRTAGVVAHARRGPTPRARLPPRTRRAAPRSPLTEGMATSSPQQVDLIRQDRPPGRSPSPCGRRSWCRSRRR